MKLKWRGMSAVAAVAVATWGLCASPASAVGEPTTTPTMTAPADASTVAGDVQISAASTELQVQFFLNGSAFGTPVATAGGAATTTWSTWGIANGGPFVWTAADCNLSGCNATQSTGVSVSLLNGAPTITSPLDGSTTGPLPALTATAPGGAVAFTVDGAPAGVDLTAPYSESLTTPLADGAHTLQVQECDVTGASCLGPTATSTFTVATPILHPQITAVSPNPFSPRVDGRNDKTAFRVHLDVAQTVSVSIRNSLNQTVSGPHNGGLLAAGDHVFGWNGRNNAGQIVADGVYTIVVTSSAPSGGLVLHGSATATVRVDDTAPVLQGQTGNGATFYPVVDGYLDVFGPKVTVNEGGGLWLQVYTTTGVLIAQIPRPHASTGTIQVLWNGRNTANVLAAAGTYRFRFLAQDAAGNRSATALGTVYLSRRYLVNKSVTLTKPGNAGTLATSDTSCTLASYSLSVFANGVWLANACDPNVDGFQVISAEYVFGVPGAIRYNSVRLQSYGNTISAPEVLAGIIWNVRTQTWDPVGSSPLGRDDVNLTAIYGSVAAGPVVNAQRYVRVAIGVPDAPGGTDYDVGSVSIVLSYTVLN